MARRWKTSNPGTASYSPCRQYRYRLERILSHGRSVGVIMMNPSEATEEWDDKTISSVQTVCARFGFGRAIIGNLFAYRTPTVTQLASVKDPIGPDNDQHIEAIAREADTLVVAWGASQKFPPNHSDRWREVVEILDRSGKPLHCLTHLKNGHPRHPVILVHDTPLPVWLRPQ